MRICAPSSSVLGILLLFSRTRRLTMVNWIKPALFLALIFAQDAVLAAKPFPRGYKRFTNHALPEASKALGVS